jgi:hypothetical protein
MGRGVLLATLVALIGTVLAGSAAQATDGVQTIPVRQTIAVPARVVNVATLPAIREVASPNVLPLTSGTGGTTLSGALKESDNPFGLTPPDMGLGADKTHVVQMVNVVGKIWTNTTPGSAFLLSPSSVAST